MSNNLTKLLSLFLSFCLILEQSVFAQSIDLSHYFVHNPSQAIPQSDKFRPLHLRYLGYDNLNQDFKLLLDKGDTKKEDLENKTYIEENTQTLLKYFFIGLALPNEKFWVNLRPDSPDNILDLELEKTDIGRIFLEADLQLKKDTSEMTSPQTKEGREYWDKLYKKAGELFGTENITIPTITRPWIVPNEIIIREAPDNAYIYKATLKVMLEEDYLNQKTEKPENPALPAGRQKTEIYNFSDPRLKEFNKYSTQLIKETIIPKLTYAVNTAKRYAQLRQVYYSLILAQWFKQKYGSSGSIRTPGSSAPVNSYIDLIDSGNLTNLTSSQPYDKQSYFQQYQKSFKEGEYNLQEMVYTPMGQSIRKYVSGGIAVLNCSSAIETVQSKYSSPMSAEHLIGFSGAATGTQLYMTPWNMGIRQKAMASSGVEGNEKSSFQPHVNYTTNPLGDKAWILSILANGDYDSSEVLNILAWLDSLSKTLWKWYSEFKSDKYNSDKYLEILQSIPTFDYKVRRDGIPRSRINSQYPKVKAIRKQIEKYLMEKYEKPGQPAVKADSKEEAEVFLKLSKMIRAVHDDLFVSSREGSDSQTIYPREKRTKNINKEILKEYPYKGYVSDIKSIDNKSLKEFLEGISDRLYDFCKADLPPPPRDVGNLTKEKRRERQKHYSNYIDKIIAKQLEMMIVQISSEETMNARKDLLNSLIDASKLRHILSQENYIFNIAAIGRAKNFDQFWEMIKDSYQKAQYIIKILITAAEIAAEESEKSGEIDLSGRKEEKSSSSLAEIKEGKSDLGGIDLRALPITTQPDTHSRLPAFGSSPISLNINFDDECQQVEGMLKNDFIPATARIRDIAYAACAGSSLNNKGIETVIGYIAQIFRKQEEHLIASEPALKQILIALESDEPANELERALKKR